MTASLRASSAPNSRAGRVFQHEIHGADPGPAIGKVDLIVTGMTATEERKKFVRFTEPYYATRR